MSEISPAGLKLLLDYEVGGSADQVGNQQVDFSISGKF